jgi:hypothetical protein
MVNCCLSQWNVPLKYGLPEAVKFDSAGDLPPCGCRIQALKYFSRNIDCRCFAPLPLAALVPVGGRINSKKKSFHLNFNYVK